MLLVSTVISRRSQQPLNIRVDNERYSLFVGQIFEARDIVLRRLHVHFTLVDFFAIILMRHQIFFVVEVVKTAVTDIMFVIMLGQLS